MIASTGAPTAMLIAVLPTTSSATFVASLMLAVWRMRLNFRAALGTSVCVAGCSPIGTPSSWHAAQNGS